MCRRLAAAQARAASDDQLERSASSAIDSLLASMGGKAAPKAAERVTARTVGVGEDVWDPHAISPREGTPPLPIPDVHVEMLRGRALRRLQAAAERIILDECGERVGARLELLSRVTLRNGNGFIDRWLASRRKHATAEDDVLLPPPHKIAADVPGLVAELEAAGAAPSAAAAAAGALGSASSEALLWLKRQQRSSVPTPTVRIIRKPSPRNDAQPAAVAALRCGKTSLPINEAHLAKLHELYRRVSGRDAPLDDAAFRACAFCALQRYESLGGAGLQAALSPRAFDVLKTAFGVQAECFASPLNCRYDAFCSAFPDVDQPFGSLGDFFERFGGARSSSGGADQIDEGSFEANPPFVPALIDRMAATMNAALAIADKRRRALSFIVIVPAWSEGKSCDGLTKSPYLRRTLIATNRKHEYCEGAQYKKPTGQLRRATCDTAVYALQSALGADRWPTTDHACQLLMGALSGEAGGSGGEDEGEGDITPSNDGRDTDHGTMSGYRSASAPGAQSGAEWETLAPTTEGGDIVRPELVQKARHAFGRFVLAAHRARKRRMLNSRGSLQIGVTVSKSMRRPRRRHMWRTWELVHRWRLRGGIPYG